MLMVMMVSPPQAGRKRVMKMVARYVAAAADEAVVVVVVAQHPHKHTHTYGHEAPWLLQHRLACCTPIVECLALAFSDA